MKSCLIYIFQIHSYRIRCLPTTDNVTCQSKACDGKYELRIRVSRSNHRRYSVKKGALKISQISQENTCVGVSF